MTAEHRRLRMIAAILAVLLLSAAAVILVLVFRLNQYASAYSQMLDLYLQVG